MPSFGWWKLSGRMPASKALNNFKKKKKIILVTEPLQSSAEESLLLFDFLVWTQPHRHDEGFPLMTKAVRAQLLQVLLCSNQLEGWQIRAGKSISVFVLADYSISLLLANESLKGPQNTEEGRGEVFWKELSLPNCSNVEDSASYPENMWPIIFSNGFFSCFSVFLDGQIGIFLQTWIPAGGQLLPNSHESFVVLPQATLSDCHKPKLTVAVGHMNCDLMPFG